MGVGRLEQVVINHPALPYAQIHDFVKELRGLGGPAKFAFEFLILTGALCGEARKATWDEVDLEKATCPEFTWASQITCTSCP